MCSNNLSGRKTQAAKYILYYLKERGNKDFCGYKIFCLWSLIKHTLDALKEPFKECDSDLNPLQYTITIILKYSSKYKYSTALFCFHVLPAKILIWSNLDLGLRCVCVYHEKWHWKRIWFTPAGSGARAHKSCSDWLVMSHQWQHKWGCKVKFRLVRLRLQTIWQRCENVKKHWITRKFGSTSVRLWRNAFTEKGLDFCPLLMRWEWRFARTLTVLSPQ